MSKTESGIQYSDTSNETIRPLLGHFLPSSRFFPHFPSLGSQYRLSVACSGHRAYSTMHDTASFHYTHSDGYCYKTLRWSALTPGKQQSIICRIITVATFITAGNRQTLKQAGCRDYSSVAERFERMNDG